MSSSDSSRRAFIKTMGVVAAAATCGATAAKAQEYKPQEQKKLTQAAAKYQDRPNGTDACGECPYFQFPKSCVLVEGDISPMGWCRMFTSFSPLDRGAHQ
ncbi:MAG TPA: twin-arginine translocation signal domain-containing protein [Micropepsaceae bacterium]|nr:twin-arginine translocation signal domain-containing protein [Micropepsaceae bacterium]